MGRTKKPVIYTSSNTNFNWDENQLRIFDFVANGSGNAFVKAVAGSGKTTTLVEAVNRVPSNIKIAVAAFNRSVAEELKKKIVLPNVTVKTCHEFGNDILTTMVKKDYAGKNVRKTKPDEMKNNDLYDKAERSFSKTIPIAKEEKNAFSYNVRSLVHLAKVNLIDPQSLTFDKDICKLATLYGLPISNNLSNTLMYVKFILKESKSILKSPVTPKTIHQAHKLSSKIFIYDFDDMLYLPSLYCNENYEYEKYDMIFIDEAQDLNYSQQKVIHLMGTNDCRKIYFGDDKQAIYGFSGSDIESISKILSMDNTITLPLSYTYRCPQNIVSYVRQKNLHDTIECPPNGQKGFYGVGSLRNLGIGDFILSRKNSALVYVLPYILDYGFPVKIIGNDLKKDLNVHMENAVRFDTVIDNMKNAIKKRKKFMFNKKFTYKEVSRDKEINYLDGLIKLVVCLQNNFLSTDSFQNYIKRVFSYTINEVLESKDYQFTLNSYNPVKGLDFFLKEIFKEVDKKELENYVVLSTFHRVKGLESNNVYIIPSPESETLSDPVTIAQNNNLIYVALTRAKLNLVVVPITEMVSNNNSNDYFRSRYTLKNLKEFQKEYGQSFVHTPDAKRNDELFNQFWNL